MLCLTLTGSTLEENRALVERNRKWISIAELRLDYLHPVISVDPLPHVLYAHYGIAISDLFYLAGDSSEVRLYTALVGDRHREAVNLKHLSQLEEGTHRIDKEGNIDGIVPDCFETGVVDFRTRRMIDGVADDTEYMGVPVKLVRSV